MADYQSVVDEIQNFLRVGDLTVLAQVKEPATHYAAACQEVNQRLRRCADFLQQGLRSEALHLAQAAPNLLDMVTVLDFPARADWEEAALLYGLPIPPPLQLVLAEILNEAFASAQPLEQLLGKHRLLALAHAPLTARLAVMREISQKDPGTPVWGEDIRTFEKARLQQIQAQANQATARKDDSTLGVLLEEIQKTPWLALPPPPLVQILEKAAKQSNEQRARTALAKLEGQLSEAVVAADVAKAQVLRKQWAEQSVAVPLPAQEPVLQRGEASLRWLAEQERLLGEERDYEESVSRLEQALSNSAGREELTSLREAVLSYEGAFILETLEGRYHTRMDDLARAARRRKIMIVAGALASLCIASGLITTWIFQARESRKATEAVQDVSALIDAGNLPKARDYLKELAEKDARIAKRPEVVAVQSRLEDKEAKKAELDRLAKESAAKQLLKDAEDAKTRESKEQFEKEFDTRVSELHKKAQTVGSMLAQPRQAPAAAELLEQLKTDMAKLKPELDQITLSKRGPFTDLSTEVAADQEKVKRQQWEEEDEKKITESLLQGQVADYVKALKDYLKDFPATGRGKQFQQALPEQELWQEVVEWNALLGPAAGRQFDLSPKEARAQAEKCRQFQKAHPHFVNAAQVDEFLKMAGPIAQQDESDPASAAASLRKLFYQAVVADLWILKTDDNKTYYTRNDMTKAIEKEKRTGETVMQGFTYLGDFQGKPQVKPIKVQSIVEFKQAPQAVIADRVKRIPANFASKTWEEATIDLAQRIRDEDDMDAVLQFSLLKDVLTLASKGSYPLEQALSGHLKHLENAGVEVDAPWINPDPKMAAEARRKARNVIGRMPSLVAVVQAAAQQKQTEEADVASSQYELAGWLASGGDVSPWQCRTGRFLPGTYDLKVVVPDPQHGAFWIKIGRLTNGVARVYATDPAAPAALVEGRLVFAQKIQAP